MKRLVVVIAALVFVALEAFAPRRNTSWTRPSCLSLHSPASRPSGYGACTTAPATGWRCRTTGTASSSCGPTAFAARGSSSRWTTIRCARSCSPTGMPGRHRATAGTPTTRRRAQGHARADPALMALVGQPEPHLHHRRVDGRPRHGHRGRAVAAVVRRCNADLRRARRLRAVRLLPRLQRRSADAVGRGQDVPLRRRLPDRHGAGDQGRRSVRPSPSPSTPPARTSSRWCSCAPAASGPCSNRAGCSGTRWPGIPVRLGWATARCRAHPASRCRTPTSCTSSTPIPR